MLVSRIVLCLVGLIGTGGLPGFSSLAEATPWSQQIADAAIAGQVEHPSAQSEWDEDRALSIEGMNAAWYNTAKGDYFQFAQRSADAYLESSAAPAARNQSPSLADGLIGKQLLLLYRVTLDSKYYVAASQLRERLVSLCELGPQTSPPKQVSGAPPEHPCTAAPFVAEYAAVFHQSQDFIAITRDLLQWEKSNEHAIERDGHAQRHGALRDVWLTAALVDSLPFYPQDDPGRAELKAALNRVAADRRAASLSSTCLRIYGLMKGVRLGYLPVSYSASALRDWRRIQRRFIQINASGTITLGSASGTEQRPPQLGALLLAATEVDLAPTSTIARGQTVMLDAWYNSQQRKNAAGEMDYFHYKWSDFSDSGFSLFGHMLQSVGMTTSMLNSAPTQENLRKAQYYIIVSPDIPIKNPAPHYMVEQDALEIAAWVKQGGVLILMENDPPNADINHLNLLADRFGIHFDDVLVHHVIGEQLESGRIPVSAGGPLFNQAHTLYMKDTCSISLHDPAVELLRDRGSIVMATARFGQGTVFAVVDPWLYNEYTDGRKAPETYSQFDNFAGGRELVRWLVKQVPAKSPGTRKRQ